MTSNLVKEPDNQKILECLLYNEFIDVDTGVVFSEKHV